MRPAWPSRSCWLARWRPSPETTPPPCEAREALAHALARNPDLRWPQIRAACDQRIAEARTADPVGRAWFANAANGFEGVPLVLLKVLPELDVLVINDKEARMLSGEENALRAAKGVLDLGPKSLVVKFGEHGSVEHFTPEVF